MPKSPVYLIIDSMKKQNITYYLKRFINSDVKEDDILLDYEDPNITKELEAQWQNPDMTQDGYDEERGWNYIENSINSSTSNNTTARRRLRFQYIAAACLLGVFMMGLAYIVSSVTHEVKEVYVFSTGKQDEKEIVLSDGTKVKLGALSQLIYPAEFEGDSRIVKLDGQAFFDVVNNEKQTFEVQIENVSVEVLGTSFEIFENKDKDIVETTLLEGSVKVNYKHLDSNVVDEYILKPDERLNLMLSNGEMKREAIDANNYCAWRGYNGLQFVNETVENIVPRLERWYNTKITLETGDYSGLNFSFKIKNEPIETILDLMVGASDIKYMVEEDENYHKTYKIKIDR